MLRTRMIAPAFLVLAAGGCGAGAGPARDQAAAPAQAPSASTGVAVVDLDEVARQLGSDVTLLKAIRDEQTAVNQQLRTYQTTLQQDYLQKKRALESGPAADPPGQDPRKQVAELERQFNLQLNQAARTAQNELKTREQKLVQRFRDEVKPVAREAAAQRGLGVVVTKNESVLLDYDDAHDITAAVVAKLRAKQPGTPAQPAAAVAGRPSGAGTLR